MKDVCQLEIIEIINFNYSIVKVKVFLSAMEEAVGGLIYPRLLKESFNGLNETPAACLRIGKSTIDRYHRNAVRLYHHPQVNNRCKG
jgi:hypothetical protein